MSFIKFNSFAFATTLQRVAFRVLIIFRVEPILGLPSFLYI